MIFNLLLSTTLFIFAIIHLNPNAPVVKVGYGDIGGYRDGNLKKNAEQEADFQQTLNRTSAFLNSAPAFPVIRAPVPTAPLLLQLFTLAALSMPT